MDPARISALLDPFVPAPLSAGQLEDISTYIDILLRWNRKLNLTAVRQPEHIVTRHFGESLFAAHRLFAGASDLRGVHLVDVGSGAGFPGLPTKLCFPELRVTLIESQQKKSVFLHEVIRVLTLADIDVFSGRAEIFSAASADVVTLRAVECFEQVLPIAVRLLRPGGRLALLIGQAQGTRAEMLLPHFVWHEPTPIPQSDRRVVLLGNSRAEESPT